MSRMFGTDGVRGVAGAELTIELATKLGQAGAYVLTKEQEHQPTLIVGCVKVCEVVVVGQGVADFVQLFP